MKPFRYRFSKLLNPVIVNRSGTNIRINGIYSKGTFLLNIPPGKVEYVEIPVLTENEISTPEEAGNAATVEMKTVKAYTFFCVAGSEFAEGGDGSESNPWASVNYALNQLQPIIDCFIKTYCCEYIQLRCSGVCNYEVHNIQKDGNGEWTFTRFYGGNRFILSGLNVEIDFEDNHIFEDQPFLVEGEKNAIMGISGTIFLFSKASCSVTTEAISNKDKTFVSCDSMARGFYDCSGIFYLCESNVKSSSISDGKHSDGGMASNSGAWAYGFMDCSDSTFIQTKSNANASAKAISRTENVSEKISNAQSEGISFYRCNGIFYSCTGKGIGKSEGTADFYYNAARSASYGFDLCNGSFYFCTGYGEASVNALNNVSRGRAHAGAYGFSSCIGSFYFCNSETDASGTAYECVGESYGFHGFYSGINILISCTANAKSIASAEEYLYKACGFLNLVAEFYDCSTSERICESSVKYETSCENFECDI